MTGTAVRGHTLIECVSRSGKDERDIYIEGERERDHGRRDEAQYGQTEGPNSNDAQAAGALPAEAGNGRNGHIMYRTGFCTDCGSGLMIRVFRYRAHIIAHDDPKNTRPSCRRSASPNYCCFSTRQWHPVDL